MINFFSYSQKKDSTNGPILTMLSEVYDYGLIEQNQNGKGVFYFTNSGNEPLIFSNIKTSCGCLVASGWPKEPVLPNDTLFFSFQYDTKRIGPINKSITINTNAVNTPVKVVRIKGRVVINKTDLKNYLHIVNVGDVPFGKEINAIFNLEAKPVNHKTSFTHKNDIYFNGSLWSYKHGDIISSNFQKLKPNSKLSLTVKLKNIHGNVGEFERKLVYNINSEKELMLIIKGKYTGIPTKKIITTSKLKGKNIEKTQWLYASDKLIKRIVFLNNKIIRTSIFNNGNFVKDIKD